MIETHLKTNRNLYRELFLKAQNEFLSLILQKRENHHCNACGKCFEIIYTERTPLSILDLIETANDPDNYWEEFTTLYIPYGAENWNRNEIEKLCLSENNKLARHESPEFYTDVKSFIPEPFFYYGSDLLKDHSDKAALISGNNGYIYPDKLLTVLHNDCTYKNWQKDVDHFLRTELSQQVYTQVKKIDLYREKFSCKCTGTCCRLSSSEFSYEELLKKAENGDNFAQQFTSIFIPYKSLDEARDIFPDYVDYVIRELGNEEIHFYHCPHISDENLCTQYEKRPDICREFPSNPLSLLFTHCGFIGWKDETLVTAMMSHAMIEIITYTLDKLEQIKGNTKS